MNLFSKARLALLCVLSLPLAALAQKKNLITTHRIFPKMDKIEAFEAALMAHAKKYHSGDLSWRVFAIQTGPDAGGYHLVEGPTSWTAMDGRGDINPEHMADWNRNIAPLLTERQSATYAVFMDSLSTVQVGDYADKVTITHVYPKMGRFDRVVGMIKDLRQAWQAGGYSVAVYNTSMSGPEQIAISVRYKTGLKEREPGFRKPFDDVYDFIHGKGASAASDEDLAANVEKYWSELLFLRKDLSSK